MRKRLLTICSFCTIALSSYAQFTSERLAVYRIGNGSSLTSNRTSAVFIDEYLTSSSNQTSPTYTLTVPAETDNGNFRLTAILRSSATAYQLEGMSGLSPNGDYLAIIGYDQPTGGTVDNNTVKVIGLINALGNINTTTTLTGNSPARAVIPLDGGNSFYSSILGGGVRYSIKGANTSTQINSYVGNARSYTIFNNTLYCANNSSQIPYYTGLPTTAVSSRSGDITLPGISNINQIALFDTNGDGEPDLIYAANDGSNAADAGLHKFKLETGSWTAKGTIKIAGTTNNLKSVTGKVVNGQDIELYATTWGDLTITPTVPSRLLKIVDIGAANSELNNSDNAPQVLATASNNTVFRSVTFTPGTAPATTLPVKINSFNAQKTNNGILLNWSTASESNNSHFEILRASGKDFYKIGEVAGNGNSSSVKSYSFFDSHPSTGTNYYQLRQVDFDEKSEKSEVISVNFNLKQENIRTWQTENTLNISFESSQKGNTQVTVSNISGKQVFSNYYPVSVGSNQISFPLHIINGVYIVHLNTNEEVLHTKFVK